MDPSVSIVPRAQHAAAAVGVLFFVNGMTFSNWLPRVPEVRDRLGLDNAGIGATLLGVGFGGLVGSLAVGRLSERFGSRRLLLSAASLLAIGLPMIGVVPAAVLLLMVLTALGLLDVLNDVAMNAQGVMVQQQLGRSIMNRLHAMWSLGFVGGAVLGSSMSAVGVSVRTHLAIVGALLLATVLATRRWLVADDPPIAASTGEATAARHGRRLSAAVVAMATAAFAAAAIEFTPNEWSAVLMRDVFDAGSKSGFGTVAVAGAMLVGRIGGDHVLDRVGERRLLAGALGVIAVGLAVTVVAPVSAVALAGLAIWGLGVSVVFPQLYATAARLPGVSAGAGLGSMLLGQRLGAMVNSVAVGGLAEWQSVQFAFAGVGLVAMALVLVSLRAVYRA